MKHYLKELSPLFNRKNGDVPLRITKFPDIKDEEDREDHRRHHNSRNQNLLSHKGTISSNLISENCFMNECLAELPNDTIIINKTDSGFNLRRIIDK